MEYTVCNKCKKELPSTPEYFRVNKEAKNGLRKTCKECMKKKPKAIPADGHKVCSKCGKELPATAEYFIRAKDGGHGLRGDCKECTKQWKKEHYQKNKEEINAKNRRWAKENPDKILARSREYKKALKESNPEKVKADHKKYYEKNKEKILRYLDGYRKTHPDRRRKVCKRWRENNPEKQVEYAQNRMARARFLPNDFTTEEWEFSKSYFHHKCAYCGRKRKLEQDHFHPLSRGGGYTRSNIIPACKSCNASKLNHKFEEWYPKQETWAPEREEKIKEYFNHLAALEDEDLTITSG